MVIHEKRLLCSAINKAYMTKYKPILLFILFAISIGQIKSQVAISSLSAEYKYGQVFLTWNEVNVTDSTHFNVYLYENPINGDNFSQATKIGHHIETSSACDWWQNPASFSADSVEDKTHGFRLFDKILDPSSGLFVHTIASADPGSMYFAVTYSDGDNEVLNFTAGTNSLIDPIQGEVSRPRPIHLENAYLPGNEKGKSLIIELHGRGSDSGISNNANYLFFGDKSHGWREGLARKFFVTETEKSIVIQPYDRIWIGRPLLYSRDTRDHVPAINTFWYGCNDKIYDKELSNGGVMVDYTEKFLIYLVSWAQEYFETDPKRTYLEGTSMGGAGGISVGFHNPEVFARIDSKVPIVAFTDKTGSDERSSLYRLDGVCGRPCDSTIYTFDGIRFIDHMNEEKTVRDFEGDLPYLVLCNGRNDESIPWINNPSFYQALNETSRGFACYWDNGTHDMHYSIPDDFANIYETLPEIELGSSFPAFSNFSNSKDPGNGEKTDGDIVGWMNRGIYWSEISETADSWSIKVFTEGEFLEYPLSVDLTPRALNLFNVEKNEMFIAEYSGMQRSVQANDNGILTIEGVEISSSLDTIKLKITRSSISKRDFSKSNEFLVYPNPVKERLTIDLEKSYRSVKVEIINGMGQIISAFEYNSVSEITMPFETEPGFYLVRIQTDEGKESVVKVLRN